MVNAYTKVKKKQFFMAYNNYIFFLSNEDNYIYVQ